MGFIATLYYNIILIKREGINFGVTILTKSVLVISCSSVVYPVRVAVVLGCYLRASEVEVMVHHLQGVMP